MFHAFQQSENFLSEISWNLLGFGYGGSSSSVERIEFIIFGWMNQQYKSADKVGKNVLSHFEPFEKSRIRLRSS